MHFVKPNWRWLAIPVSLAFVYGGLRVLLGPSLMAPTDWKDYHILTILTVAGTVGAGHLSGVAWRSGRYLAVAGFTVLFATGTVLVVRQSLNRQAETAGQSMLAAEDLNDTILSKRADLAKARKRFDEANQYGDEEMHGQKCGPRCRDWRQRAKEVQALISQLEGEIAALGPQKPVNAGAEHLASMASFFGYQREKVIALDTLFLPLAIALFFELGSVVSLGFAFQHRPGTPAGTFATDDQLKEIRDNFFSDNGGGPLPPKPRKRAKPRLPDNVVQLRHPVVEALAKAGGEVRSNHELAQLLGVCDGEASKSWREVADQVHTEKVGKQLRIRLRA